MTHHALTRLNRAAAPPLGREALEAEVAIRRERARASYAIDTSPSSSTGDQVSPPPWSEAGAAAVQALEALRTRLRPMSDAEWRRHRFAERIAPRMRALGVPARYCQDLPESGWQCMPQEKVHAFCDTRFTQIGAIVALVGERGVGKTFIAAQLIRKRVDAWMAWHELHEAERPPGPGPRGMGRYAKLVDLVSRFKPLYADFGSIETERLMTEREQLCREPLLCLDELHECEDQRLKSRVLTDILDRRYSNCVDTLLISNEVEEDFRVSIGDSALSRITEHGAILTCRWGSWRG